MATRTTTKKRNPTDSTLRNVRASRTRETTLETRLLALEKRLRAVERDVLALKAAADAPFTPEPDEDGVET